MSEIKSDKCFILWLFTGRCYIRQVSDFVCVCVCLKSNQINVLFCVFTQQVSVFVCGCVCLKSNQINVSYCVLTERRQCLPVSEIKSDQCFILCLFTGRYYIRQVSDFVCVYMHVLHACSVLSLTNNVLLNLL